MNQRFPNSINRFDSRAQAYAEFRPSYPPEAIDSALDGLGDPLALTIADVGAGTGISARLFARRVAAVIAIEPNVRMRAAAEPHPRVQWREGTAEKTGLEDRSVDAVVACQAFHWFATLPAMLEFRRVARRRAALLQYERDERPSTSLRQALRLRKRTGTSYAPTLPMTPKSCAGGRWQPSPNFQRRASRARRGTRRSVSIATRSSAGRLRHRTFRPRVQRPIRFAKISKRFLSVTSAADWWSSRW